MLNILIYVLAFIIGFTLTLGIMGGVLCSLQKHSSKLLQIIGELFIFGIICILVVTLTIVIIKPYA
jgi:hypothetical protein